MMVPPLVMVNMASPKGAFTGSVTPAEEFLGGTHEQAGAAFKVIDKVAETLTESPEALRHAE